MSLRRIQYTSIFLAILFLILSLFYADKSISLSLATGAFVSIGSFSLLRLSVSRIASEKTGGKVFFGVLLVVKLILTAAVIFIAIKFFTARAVPLLVGLSVVMLAIVLETLYSILSKPNERRPDNSKAF